MKKTIIALALMTSAAYAQQPGAPYYGPAYQTAQAAPDRAKDCDDAKVGELCFKTRAAICQPVDASNVHGDPQEICHNEVKGQVGLRSEMSKRIYFDNCVRQRKIRFDAFRGE